MSECSKLAQKEYKTRHNWFGKVFHWELCKKFKFDHTNKWYMHNPESVLENEMHKLLWNCEIQTDHVSSDRRADLVIIKKKKKKKKRENLLNCRLCSPSWPLGKIEKKKRRISTWTLLGIWKKTVEHESDGDTHSNLRSRYSHQRIGTRTGGWRIWK